MWWWWWWWCCRHLEIMAYRAVFPIHYYYYYYPCERIDLVVVWRSVFSVHGCLAKNKRPCQGSALIVVRRDVSACIVMVRRESNKHIESLLFVLLHSGKFVQHSLYSLHTTNFLWPIYTATLLWPVLLCTTNFLWPIPILLYTPVFICVQ